MAGYMCSDKEHRYETDKHWCRCNRQWRPVTDKPKETTALKENPMTDSRIARIREVLKNRYPTVAVKEIKEILDEVDSSSPELREQIKKDLQYSLVRVTPKAKNFNPDVSEFWLEGAVDFVMHYLRPENHTPSIGAPKDPSPETPRCRGCGIDYPITGPLHSEDTPASYTVYAAKDDDIVTIRPGTLTKQITFEPMTVREVVLVKWGNK